MDLSIIIVSHNHDQYLRGCLESLGDHLNNVSHEIILVDNIGTPQLKTTLQAEFPDIKILVNSRRQGFAQNCNQGFRASRGRYVLFLNPDTRILKGNFSDFIRRMEDTPDIGVACAQLLNADLSPQATIRRFPTFLAVFCRGFKLEKFLGVSFRSKNLSDARRKFFRTKGDRLVPGSVYHD